MMEFQDIATRGAMLKSMLIGFLLGFAMMAVALGAVPDRADSEVAGRP